MRVMVSGHRPLKVGGYRLPNSVEQWVRNNLRVILKGMLEREPKLKALTGMALGADTIFAEVCVELDIPFTAVQPFKDQGSRWPDSSKDKLTRLLGLATKVVIVDEIPSYHSDRFGGKMALRNKWLVDHSDQAIAVWDGSEGGTFNAVKLLRRKGRKVLRLNPKTFEVGVDKPELIDSGPDVFDMFG